MTGRASVGVENKRTSACSVEACKDDEEAAVEDVASLQREEAR
jgi:hypothetical protein